MPRKTRTEFPGAIHHVTMRGVNRQVVMRDDADNSAFLQFLGITCDRFEWRILAYCLMANHFHLVVGTTHANLAAGMQWLSSAYARRHHHRYRTSGHLFQGRYSAVLVNRDAYLLEVVRYILLNPVRAGLCRSTVDWRWSSAREALGLRPAPPWVDFSVVFGLLGAGDEEPAPILARFLGQEGVRPSPGGQTPSGV